MKKFLLIVMVVCLVVTGLGACKAEQETPVDNLDDVIITLERTACYGFCPVYTITVFGNGTVKYEGKEHVQILGNKETEISEKKLRQIIEEFERIDYYSLNDEYTERTITDTPSAITSITMNGKTKTIKHYHGDFSAPEDLSELEDRIDEIVNSEQWIQ